MYIFYSKLNISLYHVILIRNALLMGSMCCQTRQMNYPQSNDYEISFEKMQTMYRFATLKKNKEKTKKNDNDNNNK